MTKEKLDLGAAFEQLKKEKGVDFESLLKDLSHAHWKTCNYKPDRYAVAFGDLSMSVKVFLYKYGNISWEQIDKALSGNLEQK